MNPSYSHMIIIIIHLFIRWYHIFSKLLEKNGERKNLLLLKKDVDARMLLRIRDYWQVFQISRSFCYPRIGSVCFKNQLLTLTKEEVVAIKTPHLYIHPRYPRSLVEVCVVWSLLMCAGCERKLHWVFPHIYWKQWPNACGKTIHSKLLLLKTKQKQVPKTIAAHKQDPCHRVFSQWPHLSSKRTSTGKDP